MKLFSELFTLSLPTEEGKKEGRNGITEFPAFLFPHDSLAYDPAQYLMLPKLVLALRTGEISPRDHIETNTFTITRVFHRGLRSTHLMVQHFQVDGGSHNDIK